MEKTGPSGEPMNVSQNTYLAGRRTSSHWRQGIGLLDVLMGCVLFIVIFTPLFHLYSVQGLGQQKMIRDYAVAINIAENALNLIENEIATGDVQPIFQEDITQALFSNPKSMEAIQRLLGEEQAASAKYMPGFKILLTVKKTPQDCFQIQLEFIWGPKNEKGEIKEAHRFELSTLKSKL